MLPGRSRVDDSVQSKAATLLVADGALVALSKADARKVVDYMRPHRVPVGTVLIREGQTGRSDFMALVLGGEVTVENAVAHDGIVVSVLGPGSLIGEMGLIDQSPRSATCTAASDVALAMLTREALTRLIDDEPAVAARLLLAITQRVAGHLRETNRKLLALTRVTKALKQELDAAHAVNRRLLQRLDQAAPPATGPGA